jgi:uncharacterized membrane protein YgdD (TMEM256/DUF423 family)
MAAGWVATGAVLAAAAIAAGAFGAHGLKARLTPEALALWETAARYLFYSALGLMIVGVAGERGLGRGTAAAGACLLAGGLIFSGTVGALALGAPRWLGAVTPVGGLLLIAGFLVFAWSALR